MKRNASRGAKKFFWKFTTGFTLVELIVVITILAILATVGFLSLSGYSDDARNSAAKANVRMVYTAIATESATSGNSPRYYVEHSSAAALSGSVTVGNVTVTLTGGDWNVPNTNYSAGNPRWDLLRLNPDKFRLSSAFPGAAGNGIAESALAAYDSGSLTVGAVDVPGQTTISGRKRTSPVFQVAAVSRTKAVATMGNYTPSSGTDLLGLVKDPASGSSTGALVDSSAGTGENPSPTGPCPSKTPWTVCSGGAKYAFSFGGRDYMTTPGWCTNSTTPTCSDVPDTVKKRWGTYGIVTNRVSTTDGEGNTNYLAQNYPTDALAAKYCYDMTYGGFSDWFLPAKDELYQLYLNKNAIGNFAVTDTPNIYFSSTETSDIMAAVIFIGWMDGSQTLNYKGSSPVDRTNNPLNWLYGEKKPV